MSSDILKKLGTSLWIGHSDKTNSGENFPSYKKEIRNDLLMCSVDGVCRIFTR